MAIKSLRETLQEKVKELDAYTKQLVDGAQCTIEEWENEDPHSDQIYHQTIITAVDLDLETIGEIMKLLKADYLNASEVFDLFKHSIKDAFDEVVPENAGTFNVREVLGKDQLKALKTSLVETLLSLPWQHEVLVPLIGVVLPKDVPMPLHLSPSIRILEMTKELRSIEYGVIRVPSPSFLVMHKTL